MKADFITKQVYITRLDKPTGAKVKLTVSEFLMIESTPAKKLKALQAVCEGYIWQNLTTAWYIENKAA